MAYRIWLIKFDLKPKSRLMNICEEILHWVRNNSRILLFLLLSTYAWRIGNLEDSRRLEHKYCANWIYSFEACMVNATSYKNFIERCLIGNMGVDGRRNKSTSPLVFSTSLSVQYCSSWETMNKETNGRTLQTFVEVLCKVAVFGMNTERWSKFSWGQKSVNNRIAITLYSRIS